MRESQAEYIQSGIEDGALVIPRAEIESELQFRERQAELGKGNNNPEMIAEAREELVELGYN